MTRFLQKERYPGGYRSYSNAGGLRPIWAMGTHHNPCILWQYPYDWKIVEQTADRITIELTRDFHHATIVLRMGIDPGRSGFQYEARAVNKLDHVYGAFSFNLPLTFLLSDLVDMKLGWSENGSRRDTTVASQARSAFWIPAREALTIARPTWELTIHAAHEQTAGYFVDWGPGYITPDLHGVYRKLKLGEETATRWNFALKH